MNNPLSTYRIQFSPGFRFRDALAVVPYLSRLGVSCIYASPVFQSRKGSDHGYNVIDPNRINPEIGSEAEFERLVRDAKKHGLSWLQDIVPNHMAYSGENRLILDVLEKGQSSPYINFFDVEWDHPYESLRGRILAPFLGKFYGEALEDKEIQLSFDENGLSVNYYDLRFPLRLESYVRVLAYQLSSLKRRLENDHPDFIKLLGILYVIKNTPPGEGRKEHAQHADAIKKTLWELYHRNQAIREAIDENLRLFNGRKGDPGSFNLLDKLLGEQLFRLSYWKVASEELNYRRFFTINDLISLRVEDETVFNHVHRLILRLAREGKVDGLRIDHVDGLYDPAAYLRRLRELAGDVYLVVEKILELHESLPTTWPVQGTTGYDFLNYVNGVFCDGANGKAFDRIYRDFSGMDDPYEELVIDKKRLIIGKHMAGDIDRLARLLKGISSRDRYGSDITLYGLRRTLVELLAFFPVYRTYITGDAYSTADRNYMKEAIRKAREASPAFSNELRFIEKFLLLEFKEYMGEDERTQWLHFVMRFQQFTGPLMAKGFEDTVLYIYNRLLSLNDVGGNPKVFGVPRDEFHRFNAVRRAAWPGAMNATSTHDTKRGEDVRARINVLSELPQEWHKMLRKWAKLNRRKKRTVHGKEVPAKNDEYFLYQTILGHYPFYDREYRGFVRRLKEYVIKAVREAKVYTAWIKPDTEYEEACLGFVDDILRPALDNDFLYEFLPFQQKVTHYGVFNALSQALLKMTSPGIPDLYQGTELWDLDFVDPDNRKPVDFETRRRFLDEIDRKERTARTALLNELLSAPEDGRVKLFLVSRVLRARQAAPDLFLNGSYVPLETGGKWKDCVIAFARVREGSMSVTVAPRFTARLVKKGELPLGTRVWDDTHVVLPPQLLGGGYWKDTVSGRVRRLEAKLPVGEVLSVFPCALLTRTRTR